MTRAEEIALETYPIRIDPTACDCDLNEGARDIYQFGYEQAEKDMKQRFIQFVHRHYPINYTGWIQDFQRAMEDEK